MRQDAYQWFDSAEACADAAAPIFKRCKWHWALVGIQDRAQILEQLKFLATHRDPCVETGRLAYSKGKFGHQKLVEVQ